jgi:predicted dehydrogenase
VGKQSRRRFLTRTALGGIGALSFPSIVPARVLGKTAPGKQVTLGVLGVGRRGFELCTKNFGAMRDVRILAVADCFQARRDSFAATMNQRYGKNVCRAYADHREVLARKDIDGVVIATPDHWHLPLAMAAVAAGKDLYLEKPLGLALADALALRKILAGRDTVFQYGTQQRSSGAARLAVDLVRNGYVGAIERADVWAPMFGEGAQRSTDTAPVPPGLDYNQWLGPAPLRPYSEARCSFYGATHCYDYSLGFIAGWGAHSLDILQWGLDRDHTSPVHYEGTGELPPPDAFFDTVRNWDLHLKYADGFPVRFMSAAVAEPVIRGYHFAWKPNGTTFHGDEGWVSYSRGTCYMARNGKRVNTSKWDFTSADKRVPVSRTQGRNFVDCIKTRRATINPFESAIRSDTISHMSNVCVRTGRSIKWDPAAERIVGDEAASKMLDRPHRDWTSG